MGIYVWGTGCGASELLEQGFALSRVEAFVDSFPMGETFLEKPVILPQQLDISDCGLCQSHERDGCGSAPGVLCGGITAAQRMIASLQKSGVAMIVVVTGPEDKKLEKQLAQFGVFFVQNHTPEQEQLSVQLGVNFLADKCDRYFLMHADRPLRLRKSADGKGKCPPVCQRTI